MSSMMGVMFKIMTFGESHGPAVGAIVDGCPSRLSLCEADVQVQLNRRRPGSGALVSPRDEKDRVKILSGVDKGQTLGSPITLVVENTDCRPADYNVLADIPRPSHADYTYRAKYGISASSGGGRASARETVGRVAGGAVAEKFLKDICGVNIVAWVSSVGEVNSVEQDYSIVNRAIIDSSEVRCPDPVAADEMTNLIKAVAEDGDSVGGIVTCVCRGVPAGWGSPVFDKLDAMLARAMLSIPAAKGFDVGSGFAGARMRGSAHNDMFIRKGAGLGTETNRSGGVLGGISNGEPIIFRVAFKPVATIGREQKSVDYSGQPVLVKSGGRHDSCVVPRAVPIVEAMAALVLADAALC